MLRLSKIVLVVFVGLQGLFYGLNNIANFSEAVGFVKGVLPMGANELYPHAFGPAITSGPLLVVILCIIIAGELSVAALSFYGAYAMARARKAEAGAFQSAKTFALLGCVMAMVVWFGLFMVFGGAYFQMWQHALGSAAQEGAFQFSVISALVLLFVNQPD